MQRIQTVHAGRGRTRVWGELYEVGPDLLLLIGGEGLHIGAASLAERRSGEPLAARGISAAGHKEPELTDRLCVRLAEATGRRTLAVAGIHLDGITREEIDAIRANVEELGRLLTA